MSFPITSRKSTKLSIPHTILPGINLVGVLEQTEPDAETRGRRIALVRCPRSVLTYYTLLTSEDIFLSR